MSLDEHDFGKVTIREEMRHSFKQAQQESTPFMVYRIPGRSIMVAEFDGSKEYLIKPWNEASFDLNEIKNDKPSELPDATSESEYRENFSQYSKVFNQGLLQKVILSAVIREKKPRDFEPVNFFHRLCEEYPDAFCYLLFHPNYGTWCGATPEVLIEKSDGKFHTVALAGTQATNPNQVYQWEEKEKEEQSLVSQHIRSILQESGAENIEESEPYTAKAGHVVHLKTDFSFTFSGDVEELLDRIHPTPAVAGLPVTESIDLITKAERHQRSLYTGFIGILAKAEAKVYVNLRCMQIGEDDVALYVGGGLTAKSNVESEWQETRLKAKTLLNLLKTGN
jgi:isochorismate synthase